jgi:hypothetical protein
MVMLRKYGFEAILAVSILFAVAMSIYKHHAFSTAWDQTKRTEKKIAEIKKLKGLQSFWRSSGMANRLRTIKPMLKGKHVQWEISGKKLKAGCDGLTAKEVDRILTKLFRLPVEIRRFSLSEENDRYRLEWICGW